MEQYKYRSLLTKHSYGQFNYGFSKIVGIVPSAYFEELISQYLAVCAEKEWFMPKYSEVEKLLNISKEEQEKYLGSFANLGLVESQGKTIKLNLDAYIRILLDDSEESICNYQLKASDGATKVVSSKTKKMDSIKDRLKLQINGNNEKVRKMYFTWIDAIVDRYGAIPNSTVISGQNLASNYANGDEKVECAIIEKAIINVYRDMSWAINAFEKTLTIKGNLASAKPVTLTQFIDPPSSEDKKEEDYEITFGGVV